MLEQITKVFLVMNNNNENGQICGGAAAQVDGRTAKYRVDRLSGLFHTISSSYFNTLDEAEAAMEVMTPLVKKPKFGDDLFLQKRTGNTWTCVKRIGNHTV